MLFRSIKRVVNPTAQKDNQGLLGASFQVEQLLQIVCYINMVDSANHIIVNYQG